MQLRMESRVENKLQKRRAILKDSLRSTGNEELLLNDLKERRLQRRNLLSTLEKSNTPLLDENLPSPNVDSNATQDKKNLHLLRGQNKTTRFDEPGKETSVIPQGLLKEESVITENPWSLLASRFNEVTKKTKDQKSYDFFTTSFEDSHNEEGLVNEEAGIEERDEQDNISKMFDMLGYPLYTPQEERLNSEAHVYFRPSSLPEGKSTVKQLASEEGLYVGERPKISQSRIRTMENRILKRKKQDSGWFGDDGMFLVQSNPLRQLHTRPHILKTENTMLSQFHRAEIKANRQNLIDNGSFETYQLELDISSIYFSHHPLFSCEHVLSSELEKTYLKYSTRDMNAAEYYYEKLQALKMKISNLKQSLQENDFSKFVDSEEIQTYITLCKKEICSTRQQRKRVIESEYALLKKILRVEVNAVEEEGYLQREINDEIFDICEEFQDHYALKLREYNAKLAQWNRSQREHLSEIEHQFTNIPVPCPVPPSVFDELQARSELQDYYNSCHKPPGEPLLIPDLRHCNAITQYCPPAEQLRRDDVNRTRLHIKIYFNDQQVSQTKDSNLSSDFSVNFGEVFTIQIAQWPESIKLQVLESRLLTSHIITEVFVPIPETEKTIKSLVGTDQYQFTSNKISTFSHSAVGSGNSLPSVPECGILFTSGFVNATICWGVDDNDRGLCPQECDQTSSKCTSTVHSQVIAAATNLQDVKKWMENSRVDPNDPRNAQLLQLIDSIPDSSEQTNYFQLVNVEEVQRYISEEQFCRNKRFTMLCMRDEGHHGLKNKVVPLFSKSISGSVWKQIIEYKHADYDLPLLIFGDFYSSRKEEQNKFLLDIRERVLSQIHSGRSIPSLSEVVISEFIPNISALKNTLVDLFVPRRPLKPARKERKKVKTQNITTNDANIVIRVVRAFNVPVREKVLENLHQNQRTLLPLTEHEERVEYEHKVVDYNLGVVSPYIEVSYEDTVLRSTSACGANPFWNEELTIPFRPPDPHSKLQVITNDIHINLFDELVVDILEDDRKRATTVHHRIEKRWLGKFTLPFSTLILRQKIEGTFQLDVPCILLGYKKDHSLEHDPLLGFDTNHHTHLQIFINLDPLLDILPPIREQFPSNEDILKLQHASKWLKKLRENFQSRYYTATALDVSGKHVFVTRFIKAQNPPPEVSSLGSDHIQQMEFLAHYVSLVPFFPDAIIFSDNCNIWSTSDQFLQMLGGDEEEHAILLCNYFLFHGFKAWVILGHAVPEGETAYVLTENSESGSAVFWLWNPNTGVHYSQHQPHAPLISVGCVFNSENIWGNIQSYDDPSRLVFDLSNREHWCPLYSDGSEPLASVQQDLQYSDTSDERVVELQERIERSLRDHIMTLRSHFITRWNRHCSRILQSILPMLEGHQSAPSHECYGKLAEINASYQLTGFPIHLRYSDIQQLLTTVERTGIHLCEDKKVEYALAVYIHSYPNDVLSVWVYVISMIPK